jgi:N-methylhydantoinase A/oxoprolinase/acetone carboxylase beta subunit
MSRLLDMGLLSNDGLSARSDELIDHSLACTLPPRRRILTPPLSPADPSQTLIRIGIDTGGTFTDFLCLDASGLRVHKLRSTPDDPSRAILQGIRDLIGETSCPLEITHGSTVATNALLERKGARVALLTTAGFEDILLIGRQTRAELYNFQVVARRPLIEPGFTLGVQERLSATGEVLEPLTPPEITRILTTLDSLEPDSIAVCLLHAYANPRHEALLTESLTRAGYSVSASHQILPEYREFERFSTTAVNAYVTPLMASYLTRLEAGLLPSSPSAPVPGPSLRIMQSNGGSISASTARRAAVQTILSGPAGGVVGAQAIAAASGHTRIITFDMGGTSTDVSLIDGEIGTTSDSIVGDFPVRLPILDIHTVGAGGGSIAFIDQGGSLRVGPRSAGANPGPACYGTGSELTVTDANLLLGRLDRTCFLGGRMALDLDRTRSVARALARRLNLSERALAEGIVRIANSNMERAIRQVSVQRGHDPRDFALLAFGGAGGLHACDLADALDIRTVLIPEHSGVLSALGMLLADVVKDYSASILKPTASLTQHDLHESLAPLLARASEALLAEGFNPADILLTPTLDMRYRGQAYELSIPFAPDFPEAFHRAHQKLYGYANPHRPTEIVQLRLKAIGRTEKPTLTPINPEAKPLPEPTAIRPTIFNRRPTPTPIYHRENLVPGASAPGPAIFITGQSTNIIPPKWTWQIDPAGTLVALRNP